MTDERFTELLAIHKLATVGELLEKVDALQRNLAAAQADKEYAVRMFDAKEAACIDALEELSTLEAERDALRADAERYRLLRTFRGQEHDPDFGVFNAVDDCMIWGAELDYAIDMVRGG